MEKEIKGILHLADESEIFEELVKKGGEQSMGIKLSADWELDIINCFVDDKDGNMIGTLVFDNTDFQSLMSDVMPPDIKDLPEPSEEEKEELKKQMKEESDYLSKNPIKKEIESHH